MAYRTLSVVCGVWTLLLALCGVQMASAVSCYVCPGNQLSKCAPPLGSEEKVKFEVKNCTGACGKLISWNPNMPKEKKYVGLRKTVRSLEYRYCASDKWIGCYKAESAITSSIECVCTADKCNQAGRQDAGPWLLTASLLLAAWTVAAV